MGNKTATAKAPCGCARERQHPVRHGCTCKPSLPHSKVGSRTPSPSQMSLLRTAFKHNSSPTSAARSPRLDGRSGHAAPWGSSTPAHCGTPGSSQGGQPHRALGTQRGSKPCSKEQGHCAVFKTEMELLEPALQGAGEIPALPEAGCSVPEGQLVLRQERQLSSKSELRITQLGLPKTPRNLTHTNISVLGQRSSAPCERVCRVTAVSIRDVSKLNWKTAAPHPPPLSAQYGQSANSL